jgi:hypothetical protein
LPVVPSYGGDEEYSQQRQLTYQPTRGAWPPAAPRGLRPIGMQQPTFNLFGGNVFGGGGGPSMRNAPAGYSELAAQRLWSSFVRGMNGGGFTQR